MHPLHFDNRAIYGIYSAMKIQMQIALLAALLTAGLYFSGPIGQPVTQLLDTPETEPGPKKILRLTRYRFKDSRGTVFDTADMNGKVWIAQFFFTSCKGPCPITSAHLSRLQTYFKDSAVQPNIVSFSVDPKRDTPEALERFASEFVQVPDHWRFLVPDEQSRSYILNEVFKVGSAEAPVNHSTRLVLVDQVGVVRGYYSGTDAEAIKRLKLDIEMLTAEPGKE
jgi:protein SCO1/2